VRKYDRPLAPTRAAAAPTTTTTSATTTTTAAAAALATTAAAAAAAAKALVFQAAAQRQLEHAPLRLSAAQQLLLVGLAHAGGRGCALNPWAACAALTAAAAFGGDQVDPKCYHRPRLNALFRIVFLFSTFSLEKPVFHVSILNAPSPLTLSLFLRC
jgi:hypothetical protein